MLFVFVFWLWQNFLLFTLPFGRLFHHVVIRGFVNLFFRLWYGKTDKRVVIIGGGFGGTEVAKYLQHFARVDIIDTKEFFEFTPSILRAVVEPQKLRTIQVSHSTFLPACTLHIGKANSIDVDSNTVSYIPELSDAKQTLNFDYLLISSGSAYSSYKNPNVISSTRAKDLVRSLRDVQDKDQIVIVGGGYVGVELAAEIITEYPKKEIVLLHNGSRLLSRSPKAASEYSLKFLEKHGVKVQLNERVLFDTLNQINEENPSVVPIATESGLAMNAELVFMCIGPKPVSSFIPNSTQTLNEFGAVRVNANLQTYLSPSIFSCGDMTDIQEEKLAQTTQQAAWVVSRNILRLCHNVSSLAEYKPSSAPIVISLGKYDAVFTWGSKITICGFLPALVKELVEWKVLVSY
mmetsp:Transcript_12375/g.15393  ORF Transcript_12375/g.15393 Transcript_12375/m.15393 type:complete len:405 (+) Transcript_12375:127-1341(+)